MPLSRPLPQWEGETLSPHPTPLGAFGASILAPAALDLAPRLQILDPPLHSAYSSLESHVDFLFVMIELFFAISYG